MNGDILVDNISTLDLSLKNGSSYSGTINGDNTAKTIKITLDSNSSITLTGDSYITSLEDEDSSYSNINFNGYKLYVNGTAINKKNIYWAENFKITIKYNVKNSRLGYLLFLFYNVFILIDSKIECI